MKRALCLLLIAITLCTTLSVPAFAATPTGQETTVTYTVDTSYRVTIPETIDLATASFVEISAECLLAADKHLYVRIDKDRSLIDGKLMLYKDGDANASTMQCRMSVKSIESGETFSLDDTDYTVAVFETAQLKAIEYGQIVFSYGIAGTQELGTYYGTLYFTFSVE